MGSDCYAFLGGIVLVFVDRWFKHAEGAEEQEISWFQGFKIGCFQCIAMVPGYHGRQPPSLEEWR